MGAATRNYRPTLGTEWSLATASRPLGGLSPSSTGHWSLPAMSEIERGPSPRRESPSQYQSCYAWTSWPTETEIVNRYCFLKCMWVSQMVIWEKGKNRDWGISALPKIGLRLLETGSPLPSHGWTYMWKEVLRPHVAFSCCLLPFPKTLWGLEEREDCGCFQWFWCSWGIWRGFLFFFNLNRNLKNIYIVLSVLVSDCHVLSWCTFVRYFLHLQ